MSFWFYRSSKTKTFKLVWHQLIATTSRSVKFTPLELGRLCLVQLDWQGARQIVLNIAVSPVSPPGVNCTGESFIDNAVASLTRRWTSVSSESARFFTNTHPGASALNLKCWYCWIHFKWVHGCYTLRCTKNEVNYNYNKIFDINH